MRLEPCVAHGLNLARTLYELNQLEEADVVLRQVLAIEPGSVPAKESLANVLTGQDRYDEAIALARELCAHDPGSWTARLVLAGALSEAGHAVDALGEAQVVVTLQPGEAAGYCVLGGIHLKMTHGDRALVAFERALECPGVMDDRLASGAWIACIVGRGAALAQLNRHADAMADFEEVLRVDATFFDRWPEIAPYYQKALGGSDQGRQAARAPGTG
jgi:tetratricopeptide (TPR) repeat protein